MLTLHICYAFFTNYSSKNISFRKNFLQLLLRVYEKILWINKYEVVVLVVSVKLAVLNVFIAFTNEDPNYQHDVTHKKKRVFLKELAKELVIPI